MPPFVGAPAVAEAAAGFDVAQTVQNLLSQLESGASPEDRANAARQLSAVCRRGLQRPTATPGGGGAAAASTAQRSRTDTAGGACIDRATVLEAALSSLRLLAQAAIANGEGGHGTSTQDVAASVAGIPPALEAEQASDLAAAAASVLAASVDSPGTLRLLPPPVLILAAGDVAALLRRHTQGPGARKEPTRELLAALLALLSYGKGAAPGSRTPHGGGDLVVPTRPEPAAAAAAVAAECAQRAPPVQPAPASGGADGGALPLPPPPPPPSAVAGAASARAPVVPPLPLFLMPAALGGNASEASPSTSRSLSLSVRLLPMPPHGGAAGAADGPAEEHDGGAAAVQAGGSEAAVEGPSSAKATGPGAQPLEGAATYTPVPDAQQPVPKGPAGAQPAERDPARKSAGSAAVDAVGASAGEGEAAGGPARAPPTSQQVLPFAGVLPLSSLRVHPPLPTAMDGLVVQPSPYAQPPQKQQQQQQGQHGQQQRAQPQEEEEDEEEQQKLPQALPSPLPGLYGALAASFVASGGMAVLCKVLRDAAGLYGVTEAAHIIAAAEAARAKAAAAVGTGEAAGAPGTLFPAAAIANTLGGGGGGSSPRVAALDCIHAVVGGLLSQQHPASRSGSLQGLRTPSLPHIPRHKSAVGAGAALPYMLTPRGARGTPRDLASPYSPAHVRRGAPIQGSLAALHMASPGRCGRGIRVSHQDGHHSHRPSDAAGGSHARLPRRLDGMLGGQHRARADSGGHRRRFSGRLSSGSETGRSSAHHSASGGAGAGSGSGAARGGRHSASGGGGGGSNSGYGGEPSSPADMEGALSPPAGLPPGTRRTASAVFLPHSSQQLPPALLNRLRQQHRASAAQGEGPDGMRQHSVTGVPWSPSLTLLAGADRSGASFVGGFSGCVEPSLLEAAATDALEAGVVEGLAEVLADAESASPRGGGGGSGGGSQRRLAWQLLTWLAAVPPPGSAAASTGAGAGAPQDSRARVADALAQACLERPRVWRGLLAAAADVLASTVATPASTSVSAAAVPAPLPSPMHGLEPLAEPATPSRGAHLRHARRRRGDAGRDAAAASRALLFSACAAVVRAASAAHGGAGAVRSNSSSSSSTGADTAPGVQRLQQLLLPLPQEHAHPLHELLRPGGLGAALCRSATVVAAAPLAAAHFGTTPGKSLRRGAAPTAVPPAEDERAALNLLRQLALALPGSSALRMGAQPLGSSGEGGDDGATSAVAGAAGAGAVAPAGPDWLVALAQVLAARVAATAAAAVASASVAATDAAEGTGAPPGGAIVKQSPGKAAATAAALAASDAALAAAAAAAASAVVEGNALAEDARCLCRALVALSDEGPRALAGLGEPRLQQLAAAVAAALQRTPPASGDAAPTPANGVGPGASPPLLSAASTTTTTTTAALASPADAAAKATPTEASTGPLEVAMHVLCATLELLDAGVGAPLGGKALTQKRSAWGTAGLAQLAAVVASGGGSDALMRRARRLALAYAIPAPSAGLSPRTRSGAHPFAAASAPTTSQPERAGLGPSLPPPPPTQAATNEATAATVTGRMALRALLAALMVLRRAAAAASAAASAAAEGSIAAAAAACTAAAASTATVEGSELLPLLLLLPPRASAAAAPAAATTAAATSAAVAADALHMLLLLLLPPPTLPHPPPLAPGGSAGSKEFDVNTAMAVASAATAAAAAGSRASRRRARLQEACFGAPAAWEGLLRAAGALIKAAAQRLGPEEVQVLLEICTEVVGRVPERAPSLLPPAPVAHEPQQPAAASNNSSSSSSALRGAAAAAGSAGSSGGLVVMSLALAVVRGRDALAAAPPASTAAIAALLDCPPLVEAAACLTMAAMPYVANAPPSAAGPGSPSRLQQRAGGAAPHPPGQPQTLLLRDLLSALAERVEAASAAPPGSGGATVWAARPARTALLSCLYRCLNRPDLRPEDWPAPERFAGLADAVTSALEVEVALAKAAAAAAQRAAADARALARSRSVAAAAAAYYAGAPGLGGGSPAADGRRELHSFASGISGRYDASPGAGGGSHGASHGGSHDGSLRLLILVALHMLRYHDSVLAPAAGGELATAAANRHQLLVRRHALLRLAAATLAAAVEYSRWAGATAASPASASSHSAVPSSPPGSWQHAGRHASVPYGGGAAAMPSAHGAVGGAAGVTAAAGIGGVPGASVAGAIARLGCLSDCMDACCAAIEPFVPTAPLPQSQREDVRGTALRVGGPAAHPPAAVAPLSPRPLACSVSVPLPPTTPRSPTPPMPPALSTSPAQQQPHEQQQHPLPGPPPPSALALSHFFGHLLAASAEALQLLDVGGFDEGQASPAGEEAAAAGAAGSPAARAGGDGAGAAMPAVVRQAAMRAVRQAALRASARAARLVAAEEQACVVHFISAGRADLASLVEENGASDGKAPVPSPHGPYERGATRAPLLHQACAEGRLDAVLLLLQGVAAAEGERSSALAPVNARDQRGWTPLHWACARGHSEIALHLLGVGADGCALSGDKDAAAPLHVACARSHATAAAVLLHAGGADVEARTTDGSTPLHWAAASSGGDDTTVAVLVAAGADVNAVRPGDGRTALHAAAAAGGADTIRLLLSSGAARDTLDKNGDAALQVAISCGRGEAIVALLDAGATLDADGLNQNGDTLLHVAARSGSAPAVAAVLRRGAVHIPVDALNWEAATPLHVACVTPGAGAVVQLLMEANADYTATDADGNSPLHLACREGNEGAVAALLGDGRHDPNARNGGDDTPLHFAAARGHYGVVRLMLSDERVDIEATNWDEDRPLHVACEAGCAEVVALLLDAGAEADVPGQGGKTPLQRCTEISTASLHAAAAAVAPAEAPAAAGGAAASSGRFVAVAKLLQPALERWALIREEQRRQREEEEEAAAAAAAEAEAEAAAAADAAVLAAGSATPLSTAASTDTGLASDGSSLTLSKQPSRQPSTGGACSSPERRAPTRLARRTKPTARRPDVWQQGILIEEATASHTGHIDPEEEAEDEEDEEAVADGTRALGHSDAAAAEGAEGTRAQGAAVAEAVAVATEGAHAGEEEEATPAEAEAAEGTLTRAEQEATAAGATVTEGAHVHGAVVDKG